MKAIVINEYGSKEVLKETEIPKPDITDDQVLVEVHATSINPIDWKTRAGYLQEKLDFSFPIILGWDVAGTIVEVGDKVTDYQIGDEVFARPATTPNGTYAEFTAVDENLLAKKPENVTFEEAASIPLVGLTAWQCLVDITNIKKGDTVLIHAGSGGVGSIAIQLAKHFGAFVATTASEQNEAYVKELGADQFINYKTQNFEEELSDFDIVLDTMGGDILEKSYTVLKRGGKLVTIAGQPNDDAAAKYGITAKFHWLEPDGTQLQKLADLLNKEIIKPQVGHVFDFSEEQLQKAHELSETHHAKGKIVVKVK
ncbi:NADP-dependent oxidoreductase [Aquibacillus sp. 3ASR75-11]|uniref:NADP-dependent oxidoreductase n=1 Tax=Terrihalobacillus insolitus TaxID=2950438 RepID=A0A9X4AKK3_9BACI|nr:NADP-dependent oxidoreductase [Terrihalobacillus insolitus]MDC3412116.1 NADP-dependent oxidoreductase [Terrihalobacillus insolitus]MDC3423191.1 NADP-dependent oxidoreductase [Terrihalobacillus insolitus]